MDIRTVTSKYPIELLCLHPSCKTGMFSPKNLHRESKLESTSKQDSFKSSAFNQYLSPQGSDDDSVIMTWKELLAPTEKKSFWSLEEEDECSCFEIVKGTRDQGKNLDIKMKKEIGSTWNIRNHKADRLD